MIPHPIETFGRTSKCRRRSNRARAGGSEVVDQGPASQTQFASLRRAVEMLGAMQMVIEPCKSRSTRLLVRWQPG